MPVQNLEADLPAGLAHFVRQDADPMFLSKILFTDEATFTREGVYNFRNKHGT